MTQEGRNEIQIEEKLVWSATQSEDVPVSESLVDHRPFHRGYERLHRFSELLGNFVKVLFRTNLARLAGLSESFENQNELINPGATAEFKNTDELLHAMWAYAELMIALGGIPANSRLNLVFTERALPKIVTDLLYGEVQQHASEMMRALTCFFHLNCPPFDRITKSVVIPSTGVKFPANVEAFTKAHNTLRAAVTQVDFYKVLGVLIGRQKRTEIPAFYWGGFELKESNRNLDFWLEIALSKTVLVDGRMIPYWSTQERVAVLSYVYRGFIQAQPLAYGRTEWSEEIANASKGHYTNKDNLVNKKVALHWVNWIDKTLELEFKHLTHVEGVRNTNSYERKLKIVAKQIAALDWDSDLFSSISTSQALEKQVMVGFFEMILDRLSVTFFERNSTDISNSQNQPSILGQGARRALFYGYFIQEVYGPNASKKDPHLPKEFLQKALRHINLQLERNRKILSIETVEELLSMKASLIRIEAQRTERGFNLISALGRVNSFLVRCLGAFQKTE